MKDGLFTPLGHFLLHSTAVFLVAAMLPAASAQQATPAASAAPGPRSATEAVRNAPPSASANYRLMPNDVVHVRVFQEEDLETTARIAKDGTIVLPLVGSAQIGGRSVSDAEQVLQTALREYLIKPQVILRVMEYSKRRFTVLGQVNRPGTYDIPDDANSLNLLAAIGMAGGYTRIANPARVSVKRTARDGKESVFRLDAKRMSRESGSPIFEILPGDTIIIDESLL